MARSRPRSQPAAAATAAAAVAEPPTIAATKRQSLVRVQATALARARPRDVVKYVFAVSEIGVIPAITDADTWMGEIAEIRLWDDETFRSADVIWDEMSSETTSELPPGRHSLPSIPDVEPGYEFHLLSFGVIPAKPARFVFRTLEAPQGLCPARGTARTPPDRPGGAKTTSDAVGSGPSYRSGRTGVGRPQVTRRAR
jgi:hypothetical protein